MIGYAKYFDSNKTMTLKLSDQRLLKKYKKIWERVSNLMNTEFDSKPVYGDNDKYITTKIKLYGDKVNKNVQGKKIPKENACYKCLSLIMLDSVIRANKKYYPQTFLVEYKLLMKSLLFLDLSSSDETDNESDNEFDNGSNNETDN